MRVQEEQATIEFKIVDDELLINYVKYHMGSGKVSVKNENSKILVSIKILKRMGETMPLYKLAYDSVKTTIRHLAINLGKYEL